MTFCCLITQKSEEAVEGMKSPSWSPGIVGGGAHNPAASYWARDSQNATACQWTQGRALALLRPSLMMWKYIAILLLAFSSLHQWMWAIFIISAWIHLQGWLTGSGPSGLDWDVAADGWTWTLGLGPPVGTELHWVPSLGIGNGISVGPVVVEVGDVGSLDGLSFSQKESHTWG